MNKTFVTLFVRKSRDSSYSKLLEVVCGLVSFAGIKITFETGNRSILFLQMQNTSVEYTVGLFPELKHTQFTWFGNLPTPRSYWFVLMKLTNNTNKEEENLLNSTLHSSSLYSSLFSLLSVFSLSATRRFFFSVFS
jgi:hypothetical protein